ncbi:MAG: hypothetical protein RLZZ387_2949 [Chloroflexota bacterium]
MDEFTTLDEYRLLRRQLVATANVLLGRSDHASRLLLLDAAGFLWTYCADCSADLGAYRSVRCHRCGADQPWAAN